METVFIVAGAQRAGTTSLRYCLNQHPQVRINDREVSSNFINDAHFERGTPLWADYHRRTKVTDENLIGGEIVPLGAYWQPAISRIYRYNPDMKVIMLVRNPIERAYSAWQSAVNRGIEDHSFIEAVNLEPHRIREYGNNGQHEDYSYIDQGFYSRQIEHVYQYFSPHQVLFLRSDDFKENTAVTMYQVLEFLGLSYLSCDEVAQEIGNYQSSMPPEVYNELIEIYRRDIYRVEELLGWNCSTWLEPKEVKIGVEGAPVSA